MLRTLKGSPIQRWHGIVGKHIGGRIYFHRAYMDQVLPERLIDRMESYAPLVDFHWNCLAWDIAEDSLRFDEAPDFDSAREPHVGRIMAVHRGGCLLRRSSQAIWHHKWLWVMDDYPGFDVAESKRWSATWLAKLTEPANGTDKSFAEQLSRFGVD